MSVRLLRELTFVAIAAVISSSAMAQGDFCNTAVAVTAGVHNANGPSSGTGASNICPGGFGTNADWYTFTAPTDGLLDISSCISGGVLTRVSVYSGTCTTLACIASNEFGCANFSAEIPPFNVLAGQTYYIEWDDSYDPSPFTWELNFVNCAPPTATFTIQNDCPNFQYFVEVDITGMGSAVTVDITNTGGAPAINGVGAGIHLVGPIPDGVPVVVTLVHDQSSTCDVVSPSLVNPSCCVAPTATYTVVNDCANFQYFVDVTLTSLGSSPTINITNSGGAPPVNNVGLGTHTTGPYTSGLPVNVTLVAQNPLCNVTSPLQTNPACAVQIACGGPGVNETYCYINNDNTSWAYHSTGTFPLALLFNAGTIESATWDHLTIYDGTDATAPILFDHVNFATTDLTGLLVISTGADLFMVMTSDGSVSCQTNPAWLWDWTVACLDCNQPTASFSIVNDCVNFQWFIEVDVTGLGTSATVDITNSCGAPVISGVGVGVHQVGPLIPGVPCSVVVNHDQNPLCNVNSQLFLNPVCPVDVVCGGPTLNETYCYQNSDSSAWSYQATGGVFPLALVFNSGTIAPAPGDVLTIYDGPDNLAPIVWQHTATVNTDLTGVLATTTGQNMYMEVRSNTFTSCQTTPSWLWDWTVSCLDCTVPGVTYNLIQDCFHGTYDVEVVVDSTGSAPTVNIINVTDLDTLFNVGVGTYSFGPFDIDVPVSFSTQNSQNSLCRVNGNNLVFSSEDCVFQSCGFDNYVHCYENAEDGYYVFKADAPVPITIQFQSGKMLVGDKIVLYNGLNDQSALIYNGNQGGDLTGLTFNSSNPENALALRVISDPSGSCGDGQVTEQMTWWVACGAVGIQETPMNDLLVYPNPTTGELFLDLRSEWFGDVQARVYDVSGRVVMEMPFTVTGGQIARIDLSNLQNGNYIVQLIADDWVGSQQVQLAR